jgi:hypothetical protein
MSKGEKTVVKGLSFNGVTQDGNTVQVDVKDGKIVRIRSSVEGGKYVHVRYTTPWSPLYWAIQ